MAQNKKVRFGPVAITNAVTNMFNPGTLTGGVNMPAGSNLYMLITHLRVVNKTGAPVTVSTYVGATGGSAAGTELAFNGATVPANGYLEEYFGGGGLRLDTADFLTAIAGSNTALVIQGEGEIGVA